MNKIIKILMNRDGISEEEARALVKETRDEIIQDYLGLEPDYLDYILHY